MNKEYCIYGEDLVVTDENGNLRVMSNTQVSQKILEAENNLEILQENIDLRIKDIQSKQNDLKIRRILMNLNIGLLFLLDLFMIYVFVMLGMIPIIKITIPIIFFIGSVLEGCAVFSHIQDCNKLKKSMKMQQVEKNVLEQQLQVVREELQRLEKNIHEQIAQEKIVKINNRVYLQDLKNRLGVIKDLCNDKRFMSISESEDANFEIYSQLCSEKNFNEILDTYRLVRKEKKLK